MLRVGLTGGIAAGKTSVGKMFADLGGYVIRADDIAHELMKPGAPVYDEIVRHFGGEILDEDGTLSRAKLAARAFGSSTPSRIEELNRIVHPPVIQRQEQWMEEIGRLHPRAIAIVEAALILEAKLADRFDKIVVVTCRPEQRVERWAARTKVDFNAARLEVARRMAAQLPDELKIDAADFVIDNSGSLEKTAVQAADVYEKLSTQRPGTEN